MPSCVTCACRVRRKKNKCMNCFLHPPPRSHDWTGGDCCLDCDEPLCTLHCSERQLQHQLCQLCFVERDVQEFNSSDDDEGVLLDSPPADEWWDHPFYEDEREEEEQQQQAKRTRHTIVSVRGAGHDDCSICHEIMGDQTWTVALPCFGSHQFHTECIQHWFHTQRQTCPLCNNQVNVVIECN